MMRSAEFETSIMGRWFKPACT